MRQEPTKGTTIQSLQTPRRGAESRVGWRYGRRVATAAWPWRPRVLVVRRLSGHLALACFAFVGAGCAVPAADSTPVAPVAVPSEVFIAPPIKACVCDDVTGSAPDNRVARVTEDDLQAPLDHVMRYGGEVAFGSVADDSDRPLRRVPCPAPEPLPARPQPGGVNAFEHAKAIDAYHSEAALARHRRKERDDACRAAIAAFLDEVRPLLGRDRSCRRSDVWGAVRRADGFLAEDDLRWGVAPHKYVVLVSDGEHTAGGRPFTPTSGAEILLVNGTGAIGSLAVLHPRRFESPAAAFAWIDAREASTGGGS